MKKSVGAGLLLFAFAAGGTVVPRWRAASPSAPVAIPATVVFTTPKAAPEPTAGEPLLAGQHGRVHAVFYHEGQPVRRGQLLLKLLQKQPSMQQMQLQRRLAQQQQDSAALQLLPPGPAASAQLQAAQAQLAATRELLAQTVPMFNFVYVTAPADGLLLAPTAHAGDQLRPDSPVARLLPTPATTPRPDTTPLPSNVD